MALGAILGGVGSLIGAGANVAGAFQGGPPGGRGMIDPAQLEQWAPFMDAVNQQGGYLDQNIEDLRNLQRQVQGFQSPGLTDYDRILAESRALQEERSGRRFSNLLSQQADMRAAGGGGGTGLDFGQAIQRSAFDLGAREQDLATSLNLSQLGRGEEFQNLQANMARIAAEQDLLNQVATTGESIVSNRYRPLSLRTGLPEPISPYRRPIGAQIAEGLGAGLTTAGGIYQGIQNQNLMRDFYSNLGQNAGLWGVGTNVAAPGTVG